MKATYWLIVIGLAGTVALGQATGGAKAPAKPASQAPPAKAAASPTKTAAKKTVTTSKAVATKPSAPAKAQAKVAKKSAPVSQPAVAKTGRPPVATKPVEAKTLSAPAKRDPFVSVIISRAGPSADCTSGKRCLVPEQIILRGIIRTPTKWIAMIETPAKKTYYLYENDAIYNGVVAKITGDSVVFRVQAMDNTGHQVAQDIVKRVSAPVI